MKCRNILVVAFIQCWFIPELNFICEPTVTKRTRLNPTPLLFVCYPDIVSIITLETNCFSSTKKFQPNYHASRHTFAIHWRKGSSLWLGLIFCEKYSTLGPDHQRSTWSYSIVLHLLSSWICLGSHLQSLGLKSDSWILTQLLVTETVHKACSTPSASQYPVLWTEKYLGMITQGFQIFLFLLLDSWILSSLL